MADFQAALKAYLKRLKAGEPGSFWQVQAGKLSYRVMRADTPVSAHPFDAAHSIDTPVCFISVKTGDVHKALGLDKCEEEPCTNIYQPMRSASGQIEWKKIGSHRIWKLNGHWYSATRLIEILGFQMSMSGMIKRLERLSEDEVLAPIVAQYEKSGDYRAGKPMWRGEWTESEPSPILADWDDPEPIQAALAPPKPAQPLAAATGAPGHRQQFLAAPTRWFANRAAPAWSFVVIQYKAGWIAFENLSDADAFRARILDEKAGEPDAAPPRRRKSLKRRLPPYLP